MERITLGAMCLIVPAVFAGLFVLGHCIFTFLMRTVSPLEVWANKKIEEIEEWQVDDDEC